MKLSNIKTADIHTFAKSLGIKNLKAAGRSRDVILAEIIELKGWSSHDEATVEFLLKGGEIKACRAQTNDKPDLGNQSSAGKTKRKGQTEFDKRARSYIESVNAALSHLSHDDHASVCRYFEDHGLWPITKETQVWGDGGLCDHATKWGLVIKNSEKLESVKEAKEPKVKEPKVKTEKVNTKVGLISLSVLCEKHGIDGKVARRKLRSKMSKPDIGWHFDEETAKQVEQIITK